MWNSNVLKWKLMLQLFRQQKIKYGAVNGGSTAAFFRVSYQFLDFLIS